jgi:hypothetical protein
VPFLNDGVYVLVRSSEAGGGAMWKTGIVQDLGFAKRLDPDSTVGIAPKHDRRFAYFKVADDDENSRIAELLAKCSTF